MCEYCKEKDIPYKKVFTTDTSDGYVSMTEHEDGSWTLDFGVNDFCILRCIAINNCPICGRSLNNESITNSN